MSSFRTNAVPITMRRGKQATTAPPLPHTVAPPLLAAQMRTSQDKLLKAIIGKQRKIAPALPIKRRIQKFKRMVPIKPTKHSKKHIPSEKEFKKREPRVIPLESVQRELKTVPSLRTDSRPLEQSVQKRGLNRPNDERPVPPPLPKAVPKKDKSLVSNTLSTKDQVIASKDDCSAMMNSSKDSGRKPSSFREIFESIPFEPPRRVVPPPYPCWVDGQLQSGCIERVELKPVAKSSPPRDVRPGRVSPDWERYYPENDFTNWGGGNLDQVVMGQPPCFLKSEPADELLDHTYHSRRLMSDSRSYHHYDPHSFDYYDFAPPPQRYHFGRSSWEYGESSREFKYAPVEHSSPPRDVRPGRVSPDWERYYPENDFTNWGGGNLDQ
ncbi:hypothetical protein OSTOST_07188, partial [Ostertagia ostertagi]